VLRDFRVGYAPSAWDRIITAAQRDGFRVEEIAAAGLGQRGRQGGFYDRFRARIMFPVADARGRVVGFGARATRENQRPKYLNTSENELYHKGRQLFGIDRARAPAAKGSRVVVVEGYTDVLALHEAGMEETVGIMGTALTQEQLAELSRAAPSIYLALDADSSGREAMLRASRAARDRGVELLVVDMPEGTDPAELVGAEGADAFALRLESALSVVEFETRRVLAEADLETPRGRDAALDRLRPLIAATPARSATRDELLGYVADRLDVPSEYVLTQAAAPRPADRRQDRPVPTRRSAPSGPSSPCASRSPSWGAST
jgi:DNA primase